MQKIEFNINNKVKVKITEHGKKILYDKYMDEIKRYSELTRYHVPYTPIKEDEQGYSHWLLWHLMNVFGKHINMHEPLCFEKNTIVFEVE